MQDNRHVGFVALVGRPNAGKSSFLNALLDHKVSIVSNTPQTTQRPIRGIYTDEDMQAVFMDVPGFHESMRDWNQKLNDVVMRSLAECDAIVRLIDATRPYGKEEQMIQDMVSTSGKPVITVYSKVDLLEDRSGIPENAYVLSSQTREGFPEVVTQLREYLPVGPLMYSEDDITDQDVFTRISETVREKIFLTYHQEIPHSVYVEIFDFKEMDNLVRIEAIIHCENESQKKILIGKKGASMKKVGIYARKALEELFEKKVYLGLRVKVSSGWRTDPSVTKNILS